MPADVLDAVVARVGLGTCRLNANVVKDAAALREAERLLEGEIARLEQSLRGRAEAPRLSELHRLGAQMAEQLTRALGEPVRHIAMTPAQYAALGFPGAEDLANMFQFNTEFEDMFCAARRVESSRDLDPRLQSFAQWLDQNAKHIPIEKPAAVCA